MSGGGENQVRSTKLIFMVWQMPYLRYLNMFKPGYIQDNTPTPMHMISFEVTWGKDQANVVRAQATMANCV